jgi:hypothetical protein
MCVCVWFFVFFFFLGFELRASCLLGRCAYHLSLSSSPFVIYPGLLWITTLLISASLVTRITDMSLWHSATMFLYSFISPEESSKYKREKQDRYKKGLSDLEVTTQMS